jgi:micrococcal nuclease
MTPTPYTYAATLVRVIDGDTAVLDIDLGFRLRATMPFRLLGINTPEMNTPEGRAARLWAVDWFQRHPNITAETAKDPEKYGRWLAVIRPDSGASLNEALVGVGLAWPYMT